MRPLVLWGTLCAAACAGDVDLEGRACAPEDPPCLPGYVCDLGICVPAGGCVLGRVESCGACDQDCTVEIQNATPVCHETSGEYDCDFEGTCDAGAYDADGQRGNGCECTATGAEVCDNRDNDCAGGVDDGITACQCTDAPPFDHEVCDGIDNNCNQDVDESFPCTRGDTQDCNFGGQGPGTGYHLCNDPNCSWNTTVCYEKDLVPPGPVTVQATPLDAAAELRWDNPPDTDLAECVVIRKTDVAPANRSDGDRVHSVSAPAPGQTVTRVDPGLTNGTRYGYAVYCRDHSNNWQTSATPATVRPTAQLPANPTDLRLSAGDTEVTVRFTPPPSTFTACVLVRKRDSQPVDHQDVDLVLATYTPANAGAQVLTDTGLDNGTLYYYAVFCHVDDSWNDTATDGDNLASIRPRPCTVTAAALTSDCGHYANGQGGALMIGLTLSADCPNLLTELDVHEHPASTHDTELSNFRLYRDDDGSGGLSGGDEQLDAASLSGTTVAFDGLAVPLDAAPVPLLVVADVGTVDGAVFVAWQVTGPADVHLQSPATVSLTGGVIDSPAHTLRTGRCPADSIEDFGAGTFGAPRVDSLRAEAPSWSDGAGNDSTWSQVASDQTGQTADCLLTTAGAPNAVIVSDEGESSVVLRIETGVPLGLPLCGLKVRLFGTRYDGSDCNHNPLPDYDLLYLYYYDGDHTVAGGVSMGVSASPAPAAGDCDSHFDDFDLSALFGDAAAGGGVDSFRLRIVAEEGGGLAADGSKVTRVPELFFRIEAP